MSGRGQAYASKIQETERDRERRRQNSAASTAKCQDCKKTGGVELRYRLCPRSWRPEWRRLCRVCAGGAWFSQRFHQGGP